MNYDPDSALIVPDDQPLVEAAYRSHDLHPMVSYLTSLRSPRSQYTMRRTLEAVARRMSDGMIPAQSFPWHRLRYPHVARLTNVLLEDGFAPATVNKYLAAVRGVVNEARKIGYLSADEAKRVMDVKSVPTSTLARGRALSRGEIQALLEACYSDDSPAGVRDAAIFAVAYGGGLRRQEIVNLELKNYTTADGAIIIKAGKGRKDRIVYLDGGAKRVVDDWLDLRGDADGPIFTPINKGGAITIRSLSTQAIMRVCLKRAEQGGVAAFTPHDFRRTCITDLLKAGEDVGIVKKIAGHSKVETTLRYDQRDEEFKRKAAAKLHVPYRRNAGS